MFENQHSNEINTNLINILQNVLDKIVISFENNDVDPENQGMLLKMFQCLEILYENIELTQEEATDVHNWIVNYCKNHTTEGAEKTIVHKLLFSQRIRTMKGPIFEGIAKQIESLLGQINEVTNRNCLLILLLKNEIFYIVFFFLLFEIQEPIEDADDLKSITTTIADTCINQLCNAVRKQVDDIEYFILKVKSYCAQLKNGGQSEDDRSTVESRMVTAERRICTQLIFISRVCIHLGNTYIHLGNTMDNFTKLLIQLYACLANLAKHFINRQRIAPVSYKSTKFDQLVQTIGKKLPLKVYAMITYIEENIFDEEDGNGSDDEAPKRPKKKDAKTHKAKVMRDTKNIPKLILRIENFNRFVIALSKKTEHDLNKLLHIGTVRDFRIKTGPLREAIEKIRANGASDDEQSENEDDDDDDASNDSDSGKEMNQDDDEDEAVSVRATGSGCSSTTTPGSIINEVEHDTSLRTSVMKNLNAINKRASKRKKNDAENGEENENNTNQRKKKKKENDPIEKPTTTNARRSKRNNPTTT